MKFQDRNWSEIPKQTLLSNREKGIVGDCWRCCIAAVLGLPAAEVPHFLKDHRNDCDGATQQWLNERGYFLIHVRNGQVNQPSVWQENRAHDPVPVITCGLTARTKQRGQHHATVYYGDVMVYDPHPDNSGLTWVTDRYVIGRLL